MRSIAFAVAALVAGMPARPSAQTDSTDEDGGGNKFLEVHVGAFLPQSHDLQAFRRGRDFSVTFGAWVTPNVALEGELGYLESEAHQRQNIGFEVIGGQVLPIDAFLDQSLAIVPLTASVRYRMPVWGAEVSALAGGGIYLASLTRSHDDSGVHPFYGDASDQVTIFGFHVGVAAAYHVSPMVFGVEARRTLAEGTFARADMSFAGQQLPTHLQLDGLRVVGTVGFRF